MNLNLNTILCKTAEGIVFIKYKDIICLKADRNYTEVYSFDNEKPLRVMENLNSFKLLLPQNMFFQCHRSYIINTNHIALYRKKCKELLMIRDIIVPVSRSNEKGLLQRCR